MTDFDIDSFSQRLDAKNRFDGNLVFGAQNFHAVTKRSGKGRPSSGGMTREHAKVVTDTGVDRYQRKADIWEEVQTCPVCGSSERDFFLSRYGLDIYRCLQCTHRYLNPRVSFGHACEIYGDDKTASDIYTQPMQVGIDEIKYQYGLDLIRKATPPAAEKIMDIGCGAGTFLKIAEKNKWKICVGIDINERYKNIYQEAKGIQFINATFESLDQAKLSDNYDCISMWSVLEHLYQLDSIIPAIKRLLKPGGLLFILVPNVESLATRLMREMSPTFNWKHVSHFSPASLRYLMENHDLEQVFFETAITEIDNIKSYMSGEYPYHGFGDPKGLFDFITPEYILKNDLGSRIIAMFRNKG